MSLLSTLKHRPYGGCRNCCKTSDVLYSFDQIIFPTLVSLLRFTSHLSIAIAVAITAVANVMDDFVPRFPDLVECLGLWLLTLICCRKPKENKQRHWTELQF